MMDKAATNTDRELWREVPGDYYSPSLWVTEGGGIGMGVGGLCFVRPIRKWHDAERRIAALEAELAAADDRCSRLAAAMAVVQEQAEDDGLWFRAEHVTEDYLQCALRRLHRVIEGEE